jgi:hypothetical protein
MSPYLFTEKNSTFLHVKKLLFFENFSKDFFFSPQVESLLVVIRVLSFLGQRLKSIHALFHFCLSFLDLLGLVMHFSKFSFANLINAYFKLLQTLSFNVTYWHVFKNALLKKLFWIFFPNPITHNLWLILVEL